MYALVLEYAGRTQEVLPLYEEAMRLMPIPTNTLLRAYSLSLIGAGRYDETITLLKKAVQQEPNYTIAHVRLTECYWLTCREEEARAETGEVLRIHPKFIVGYTAKTWPYKNQADMDLIIKTLRKAGLNWEIRPLRVSSVNDFTLALTLTSAKIIQGCQTNC